MKVSRTWSALSAARLNAVGMARGRSVATRPGQFCAVSGGGTDFGAGCSAACAKAIAGNARLKSPATTTPRMPAKILDRFTAKAPIRGAIAAPSAGRICHGMRPQTMMVGRQRPKIDGPRSTARRDHAPRGDDDPLAVLPLHRFDPADTGQNAAGADFEQAAVAAFDQRAVAVDVLHDPVFDDAVDDLRLSRRRGHWRGSHGCD